MKSPKRLHQGWRAALALIVAAGCADSRAAEDSRGSAPPTRAETLIVARAQGANSLDIVEVVSATMRELKVKVPRAELSKLENLDGLVDLLLKSVQQAA